MKKNNLIEFNKQLSECPLCEFKIASGVTFVPPPIQHLDFEFCGPSKSHTVTECENCGLIFNSQIAQMGDSLSDQYFSSQDYKNHLKSRYPDRIRHSLKSHANVVTYVTNLLSCHSQPKILDVGCFDGGLIHALQHRNPHYKVRGYDIAEREPIVRSLRDQITFAKQLPHENLSEVEKFDLIILSESLVYVKNIKEMMAWIARISKKNCRLLILAPNVLLRPEFILMGDCFTYFTPTALKSVLEFNQHSIDSMEEDFCKTGHLMSLSWVHIKPACLSRVRAHELSNVSIALTQLADYIYTAASQIREDSGDVYIFGNTAAAALCSYLIETFSGFVVDDGDMCLKRFHNRIVTQIANLPTPSALVDPRRRPKLDTLNLVD